MAEKKRIEWCRYYKGNDSFDESESKKNRLYDYFWSVERCYVAGEVNDRELKRLSSTGLGEFDTRLPKELLASLFSCVIHLHPNATIERCVQIFTSSFYPSYINKSDRHL